MMDKPIPRYIKDRVIDVALYIKHNNSVIRDTAHHFGVSKTTVYNDVTYRLPKIDKELYTDVRSIIVENKKERSYRGGVATYKKYKGDLLNE